MIRSLRWKFVLVNMTIVTIILAALFLILLHVTRSGIQEDSLLVLQRAASSTGYSSTLTEHSSEIQIPYFTVDVDASGKMALVNGSYYTFENLDSIRQIVIDSMQAQDSIGILEDYGLRYYRQSTLFGTRIAYVDVSLETSVVERFTENALLIGGAALLVFFGISVLLSRWAVRPAERAWNQQRQFVEDASHDLRTPLTVVMSNADMLLAHPDAEPAKTAQWTRSIKSESQHMRQMVEELLTLARVENVSAKKLPLEFIDLSSLVTDSLLQLEATVYESGRQLSSEIADGVVVPGQAKLLLQLLENLLTNAIKYSDAAGRIQVTLAPRGKVARLMVANTGAAIPREMLERIFERFRRLDPARESGGFGLGLAIAKGIVQQHHGKIWAESDDGWNRFLVELPLKR